MYSLNIIIPTFNRLKNLFELVEQFTSPKWKILFEIFSDLNIFILNDYHEKITYELFGENIFEIRKVGFKLTIKNNAKNLGQGINFATHMRNILTENRGLFVTIADDDLLLIDEYIDFIKRFYYSESQVGIGGFIQNGENHNFCDKEKIIKNKKEAIKRYTAFGKGTGIIMSLPTKKDQEHMENIFLGSMYEDKAYGCLQLNRNSSLFIYPKPIAKHSGGEIILLNYSFRVYINLDLISYIFQSDTRLKNFLLNRNDLDIGFLLIQKLKLFKLIILALRNNLLMRNIRYKNNKILLGDLKYLMKNFFAFNAYEWQKTIYDLQ